MRVLLTGGRGFVGSRLLEELAPRHEVFAVAPETGGPREGVEWIAVDLAQPLDRRALPGHVDAIVHLAQSRRYREFPDGAADMLAVNVSSTFELLEYARRASTETFVFASSGGVYGYSYERFAEADPVSPLNFYLSSKYSAELLIANYGAFFNTVVVRPFFLYGPRQRGMLIPTLLEQILHGRTVTVYGDPGLRINPLHIDDAVRVFEPALRLGGSGLFNIAGDEVVTMTQLVELLGEVAGCEPVIAHTAPDVQGDLVGDNRQMKEVLGVVPRVSLRDGVTSLVRATVGEPTSAAVRNT